MLHANRSTLQSRRGAMLVLIVVLLVAFFAAVCFTVDIGLPKPGDVRVARLGGRGRKSRSRSAYTHRRSQRGRDKRQLIWPPGTTVGGEPLLLDAADIELGAPDFLADGSIGFNPGQTPLSAARVTGRRTADSPSGTVNYFFGPVLGTDFFEARTSATAARKDRDIALVLDRSGSMRGRKIGDLKTAVNVLLA